MRQVSMRRVSMRRVERYAVGLARFCVGHRGVVCLLWLAVLLVGGAAAAGGLGRLDQSFTASGQDGSRANAAITERYGSGAGVAPLVAVVTWPDGTDGRAPGAAARLASGLAAATAPGTRVLSYADTGDETFSSRDGRTTYALVYPRSGEPDLAGLAVVRDATERLRTGLRAALPTARVNVTGVLPLQEDSAATGPGAGLLLVKVACALAALALLVRAFRLPLVLLPLLLAVVSSVAALLVAVALAGVVELSFVVVYLIPVAALALSVRRSALLLAAWRSAPTNGADALSAARRAGAAVAGPAAAGALAAAVPLLALALFPVPFLRSIGIAGAAVCLAAALASLTLAPALLSWLPHGRSTENRKPSARPRWRQRRPRTGQLHSGSRTVHRLSAVGVLVTLGLLTAAAGFLTAGNPVAGALVRGGPARDGLDQLTAAGIPSGVLNPLDLLAPSGVDPDRVASSVARIPGVLSATAPQGAPWRLEGSALIAVLPSGEPMTGSGRRTTADVRSAAAAAGAQAGGSGVPELDLVQGVYRVVPFALALMALLAFAVIARLRSVRWGLRGAGFALVTPVAASGVLVLVWQYGAAARLLGGVGATGAVTGWIPLVAGAFAFLDAVDRTVASHPGYRSRSGAGPLVALSLLAIGIGPQVELAVLATGLGGAALLGSALFRALPALPALPDLPDLPNSPALPALPERSHRALHEKDTESTTSALPATLTSSYWSRPRSPLGHTIPLAEPSDHAQ
ncbi:MMPL family transporter [Streptomyces sp. NPDC048361]|uniref:MMPL family transporter n=1 Tax=Streptomyces sp. NPDC048361 TaxID=3154720 RepID=UPI00343EB745